MSDQKDSPDAGNCATHQRCPERPIREASYHRDPGGCRRHASEKNPYVNPTGPPPDLPLMMATLRAGRQASGSLALSPLAVGDALAELSQLGEAADRIDTGEHRGKAAQAQGA